MALKSAILDLRKMNRSMNLRKETDPAKAAVQLQEILIEALHLQNSGARTFQKSAVSELKQLREDMSKGQITLGRDQHKMTGLYSHVIDQIDRMSTDNESTNSIFSKGIDTVSRSIPSSDTLIAALMSANPIAGYSTKIVRDIFRSRNASKAKKAQENRVRLQTIKNEAAYVKEQLAQQQEEEKVTQGEKEELVKKKREGTKGGVYKPVLTQIRDELANLYEIWGGERSNFEQIEDAIHAQTLIQVASNEELIDKIQESEKEDRKRRSRLTRMKSAEVPKELSIEGAGGTSAKANSPDDSKDMFSGMFNKLLGPLMSIGSGLIGGLLGMFSAGGGISKLFSGITSLFGFIMRIGTPLLSILPKLLKFGGPIVAIATVLYEFFDGFINAGEIISKVDVTLWDRFMVGISNVFGSLATMVDNILEFFGIDLFDSEDMTKKIYDFFTTSIPATVDGWMKSIGAMWNDIVTESGKILTSMGEYITEKFNATINSVKEVITGVFDSVVKAAKSIADFYSSFYKMIWDKLTGTTSDAFRSIGLDSIADEIKGWSIGGNNVAPVDQSPPLLMVPPGSGPFPVAPRPSELGARSITGAEHRASQPSPLIIQAPTTNNNNVQGGGRQQAAPSVGANTNNPHTPYREQARANRRFGFAF